MCFNTKIINIIKVLSGFLPAFLTFQFTQPSHTLLAWMGAPLWFLVTGLRNILQAVLGGGGLRRSPLIRWNNYVSWSRLCDSLMFTGFSVVLLELLLRRIIVGDILHLTTGHDAVLIFTLISLVNGLYLSGHNYLRGLQREAVIGNLFRSFFAIPVALVYNLLLAGLLNLLAVQNADIILLASAAITSKVASDTVAGIIEGIADRNSNMYLRIWDYDTTIRQIFNVYSRLETLLPEQNVLEMMLHPKELLQELHRIDRELYLMLFINALDFMYFWFFQPRAVSRLSERLHHLSPAEKLVIWRSQQVLTCEKEVSLLVVDGLVGPNFSRALSFYLERHDEYLRGMKALCLHRTKDMLDAEQPK